ncbi:putative F-box protein PP2-B12 isoform X4 [Hordeum vulgare subsp. vulgare]|uniref:putative F-box protein PP2-B12 isoform X4 n=1 Tax=Hordeum vulgare subsp. vulgare TaxID=112509 RepID=UPI001D1A4FA2|nr:putative F-box protein PP2-B12 isoform X4 [Hordeum vulgare subsp. vulgare]
MGVAWEIARLPEELVLVALARTSPRTPPFPRPSAPQPTPTISGRASCPPTAFRRSPMVSRRALPRPHPRRNSSSAFPPAPRFSRSGSCMWLDRETGAKCYMISVRNLFIMWGNTPEYWSWIPLQDSRVWIELPTIEVDLGMLLELCLRLCQREVIVSCLMQTLYDGFIWLPDEVKELYLSIILLW